VIHHNFLALHYWVGEGYINVMRNYFLLDLYLDLLYNVVFFLSTYIITYPLSIS